MKNIKLWNVSLAAPMMLSLRDPGLLETNHGPLNATHRTGTAPAHAAAAGPKDFSSVLPALCLLSPSRMNVSINKGIGTRSQQHSVVPERTSVLGQLSASTQSTAVLPLLCPAQTTELWTVSRGVTLHTCQKHRGKTAPSCTPRAAAFSIE